MPISTIFQYIVAVLVEEIRVSWENHWPTASQKTGKKTNNCPQNNAL